MLCLQVSLNYHANEDLKTVGINICLIIKYFWQLNLRPLFLHSQIIENDLVAQLVEQYTFNVWALGSSPSGITKSLDG